MKKNMRKVINAVAAMLIGVSAFTGCSNKEETQKKETIQKNNQKQEVSEHKKKETNREQNEIKKEEMEDAVNLDDNQKDQEMHAENEQTQKSDIIANEKAVKKDGNHKQNDKNKQKDSLKNNSQIIQTEEKKETPDQTEIHKLLDTVKNISADNYTPSTYRNLKAVWDKVESSLQGDISQKQLDQLYRDLQTAYTGLIKRADLSELYSLIEKTEKLQENDYTPNSYHKVKSEYESAVRLYKDSESSQQSVNHQVVALRNALKHLDKRADVTALKKILKQVDALDGDQYMTKTYEYLMTVYNEISALLDNPNVNQEAVDLALVKVNKAINQLAAYIAPNTDALYAILEKANTIQKQDWSEASVQTLEKAVKQAESILAHKQMTQQEVDAAVKDLKNAYANLSVDTAPLADYIQQLQQLTLSHYTASSAERFSNLLKEAKDYLINEHTQKEIDMMKEKLMAGVEQLEVKAELDKTELREAIDNAEKCLEDSYTPSSYASLKNAVEQSCKVVEDRFANEMDIQNAIQQLKTAQEQLVKRADRKELSAWIAQAEEKCLGNYMKKEVEILKEQLQIAKKESADLELIQTDADMRCKLLQNAISALIEKGDNAVVQQKVSELDELDENAYTEQSIKEMKEIMETIRGQLTDEISKDQEIQFLQELEQAFHALQEHADATVLKQRIAAIKQMHLSPYYTEESIQHLEELLAKANKLIAEEVRTAKQIQEMLEQLDQGIQDLTAKESLEELLKNRLLDAGKIDERAYTKDSILILENCVTAIQEQLKDSEIDDMQRITLLESLEKALSQLVLDVSELQKAINQADAVNDEQYTEESLAVLSQAKTKAETILHQDTWTQEEIIEALQELQTAYNDLVEKEEASLLEQLVAIMEKGDKVIGDHIANDYTDESYERYSTAYYYALQAKLSIQNGSYNLEDENDVRHVKEVCQELSDAIDSLTLYDGVKTEDQVYIDILQAAVDKGTQALTQGSYDAMNVKALQRKLDSVNNTITDIKEHKHSFPHNEAGKQQVMLLAQGIDEYIAKLNQEVAVEVIDVETEVVTLLNEKRSQAALPEIVINEKLSQAAAIRAEEMSRYLYLNDDKAFADYAHLRPDGSNCFTVLNEVSFTGGIHGENAAISYYSGSSLFQGWWNSEGHRANMMNADFQQIGVAIIRVGEGQYLAYMMLSS